MATREHGPAYLFWLRVQDELERQNMSQRDLVERSGVTATTISRLKTTPPRERRIRRQIVLKLADVLAIPHDEAYKLAGLEAPDIEPSADVRAAIDRSTDYSPEQKKALLGLLDVLDAANADSAGAHRTG
ncbi:MAG TPA: helix-turn-helix transcriptional regulator [Micromonosporaceae bacterium]|nr:helix-turn-helix transcriptional regulator [Micromonosporaceae bacterium]